MVNELLTCNFGRPSYQLKSWLFGPNLLFKLELNSQDLIVFEVCKHDLLLQCDLRTFIMANTEKGLSFSDGANTSARKGSVYEVVPPGDRRMSAQGRRVSVVDDIFGEIKEGGPNYRNVTIAIRLLC